MKQHAIDFCLDQLGLYEQYLSRTFSFTNLTVNSLTMHLVEITNNDAEFLAQMLQQSIKITYLQLKLNHIEKREIFS